MTKLLNIQKIGLLLLVPIFLFGCAAPQYKTTYETRERGTDKYVETSGHVSSISSVSVYKSGILTIDSSITSYETEYEGPKMEDVAIVRRPADPVGALVNTAATVGLNLLFEPKKTGSQAIGDTQGVYVNRTYVDKSRAKPTGRNRWNTKPISFTGSILLFGLKDQPIELYVTGGSIDISAHLKESNQSGQVKLKIICKHCQDLRPDQTTFFSSFTREKNIEFNIDEFKALQKSIEKSSQIKPKQSNSTASQRCLNIGLREGSDDYIKCLKTLLK